MDLGKRLKQLRELRNLTLDDVGFYVGVNKATVQRYESGNIDIKRNIALKLSEVLKTTPSYIMGWSDDIGFLGSEKYEYIISHDEKQIIDNYRILNKEGQEDVIKYIDVLVASGKYIKNNKLGMGEKEKA